MNAAANSTLWATALAIIVGSASTPLGALPLGDTFTYSHTNYFYGSTGSGGDGARVGTTWTPIAPPALESISVSVAFNSSISAWNPNPFPVAQDWNVFIYWTPQLWLQLPNGTSVSLSGATRNVYVSGVVPPNGALSTSGLFVDTLLLDVVGAACVGPDPLRVVMMDDVFAGTQYGSGSHAATFTARITYNSVPEGGDSVLFLGSALAGLLMLVFRKRANDRSATRFKVAAASRR